MKINGKVQQLNDQSDSGTPSGITFVQIQEEILQQMSEAEMGKINDFLQTNGIPLRIQNIIQGSLVVVLKVLETYEQQDDFKKHIFHVITQIFHKFMTSHMVNQPPVLLLNIDCTVEQLLPDSYRESKGKFIVT